MSYCYKPVSCIIKNDKIIIHSIILQISNLETQFNSFERTSYTQTSLGNVEITVFNLLNENADKYGTASLLQTIPYHFIHINFIFISLLTKNYTHLASLISSSITSANF